MINEIFTKAAEELNSLNFYTVSLNEFMYNHESTTKEAFPAIVFFNDVQSVETQNNSGRFQDTQFTTRWLFGDKIEVLDDFGSNVLEVQDRMRMLARQYFYNVTTSKEFQLASNEQQQYSFDTTSFAHEFDSDLAGVFVTFTFFLRLSIDYCKFEC